MSVLLAARSEEPSMSWILSTKSVVTAGLLACGSLFAQTASVQTAHSLSEEPTLAPPIARYAPRDMRPDGRGNFPTTLMNLRRSRLAGGAAEIGRAHV